MDIKRSPFQGVTNILRFNWHFYVGAILLVFLLCITSCYTTEITQLLLIISLFLISFILLNTLIVSTYIYDFSSIYQLNFIQKETQNTVVNLSAGFDEILPQLRYKFGKENITSFDFYNAEKHTEVSIQRARKLYPPDPSIQSINTDTIPLRDEMATHAILFFAAHEIRNKDEQLTFFKEVNRILQTDGTVYITEHLRDSANFLAFNIGFFHFHSAKSWKEIFQQVDFCIFKIHRNNPFVVTYILKKNGDTP